MPDVHVFRPSTMLSRWRCVLLSCADVFAAPPGRLRADRLATTRVTNPTRMAARYLPPHRREGMVVPGGQRAGKHSVLLLEEETRAPHCSGTFSQSAEGLCALLPGPEQFASPGLWHAPAPGASWACPPFPCPTVCSHAHVLHLLVDVHWGARCVTLSPHSRSVRLRGARQCSTRSCLVWVV